MMSCAESKGGNIEVCSCLITDEEIEEAYRQNSKVAKRNESKIKQKVITVVNESEDRFSLPGYTFLRNEHFIEPKTSTSEDVDAQIGRLIAQNYEEEKIKIEQIQREYEKVYHEWQARRIVKPNCNTIQLSPDDDTFSSHYIVDASSKEIRGITTTPSMTPNTVGSTTDGKRRFQNIVFRRRVASDAVKTEAEFQAVLELLSGDNGSTAKSNDEVLPDKDSLIAIEPDIAIFPNDLELLKFANFNDRVVNFKADFLKHNEKMFSIWSVEEREIFYKNFLIYAKDFHKIASCLPHKSVNACVHYYYREKQRLNLSSIARKSLKQRKRILRSRCP